MNEVERSQSGKGAGRGRLAVTLAIAAFVLAACEREEILSGPRFDVRTPLAASVPGEDDASALPPAGAEAIANRSEPISLPGTVNHGAWTHRNGNAQHRIVHPALGLGLSELWSVGIGQGDTRRASITADPVVVDGRIFAMDSASQVSAVSTAGARLWSRSLVPDGENERDATGGGLAFGSGGLFATTGYGQLHRLDPATGAVLWTQRFDAPVAGAPTVAGDLVYVTSRDSRAFAVRADNGRLEWQVPGAPTPSSTIGGSGPAVTDRLVVFPFGSGELIAALRQGGVQAWSSALAGRRLGRAFAGFTDVTGDPVVDGNVLYAGSASGRIAAIDARSGDRIWTATEGALSPVWPTGGSVFAVTDLGELVRLDGDDGSVIWAVSLPYFQNERVRRRRAVFGHYGPVLAGGRLLVASDDGQIRSFDPRDGRLLSSVPIRGGATTNPAIVNGTLYLVSGNGQLVAFR